MNEQLSITLMGDDRRLNFPKVGELFQIENIKVSLSQNYDKLNQANTFSSELVLDIVDAASTFSVLVPDKKKEILNSLDNSSVLEILPMVKEYKKKYEPWYNKKMKEIQEELEKMNSDISKEEEDTKS